MVIYNVTNHYNYLRIVKEFRLNRIGRYFEKIIFLLLLRFIISLNYVTIMYIIYYLIYFYIYFIFLFYIISLIFN